MDPVRLSQADFAATVAAGGIVVVHVGVDWHPACSRFAPVLAAAAGRHRDIVFASVDAEAQVELAAAVGARSVPTLLVYRDGVLVFAEPGALPADSVELLIATVRELDMVAVRELFPSR